MDIRKTQALRDILKDKQLLKDKCYIDGKWVGGIDALRRNGGREGRDPTRTCRGPKGGSSGARCVRCELVQ